MSSEILVNCLNSAFNNHVPEIVNLICDYYLPAYRKREKITELFGNTYVFIYEYENDIRQLR